MEHIGGQLQKVEQNMRLNTADPIALHGFTQLPNFILRNPDLSTNAKTTYALLLSQKGLDTPHEAPPGMEDLARLPHLTCFRPQSGRFHSCISIRVSRCVSHRSYDPPGDQGVASGLPFSTT